MTEGIALAVILLGLVVAPALRPRTTLALMIVATFGLLPVRLFGTVEAHLGIAGHDPRIMTYSIPVILFLVASILGRVKFRIPMAYGLLAAYLLVGMALLWDSDGPRWAGVTMMLQAIACYAIGSYLAATSRDDPRLANTIVVAVLAAVVIQSGVSALQYLGVPIFVPDASTAELMGSRVNGTFNHPAALGKAIFLLDVLILVLLPQCRGWFRFAAYGALLLGFFPLLLTGSRANLAAVLALTVAWVILLPSRGNIGRKLMLSALLALAAVLSIGVILSRFEEDPGGGAREYLNQRTLDLIGQVLPAGSGPNSFIAVFGQWDQLIASGWLVHNTPLLLASEIGILGAALLLWPMARLVIAAVVRVVRPSAPDMRNAATVTLAALPGVVVIGATGWGFVHEYTLPFLLLTVGFLAERTYATARVALPVGAPADWDSLDKSVTYRLPLTSKGLR